MTNRKREISIFLSFLILLILGVLLFACRTSNEQERQITNAFTPGKTTQEANPQTQPPVDFQTVTRTPGITQESQPAAAPLPSDQPTMMITNTQGQTSVITQTRAATQPNQIAPTRTSTKKPSSSPSNTPTNTATLTPSPTIQPGWAGEWTAYFGKSDSSISTGTLQVSVVATTLTGSLTIDNMQYKFDGIVFNDGKFATGNWLAGTSQGSFWWNLIGDGQFRGCHTDQFAFCGSRAGVNQPEPCRELPSR